MDFSGNVGTVVKPDWQLMTLRLCFALVAGLLVAAIYRGTRPRSRVNPSFPPTLVLLAILIAMVTQVIGSDLARAFSLVGALSIIRFRTVVRDTQDTAFVIFAVVVGMAVGAGSYPIAITGILIGGLAAAIVRTKVDVAWAETENTMVLRLGIGPDPATLLAPIFEENIEHHEVVSVSTVNKGAAIEYTYRLRVKPEFDPAPFVKALNQLEGVQNVELRRGEAEQP